MNERENAKKAHEVDRVCGMRRSLQGGDHLTQRKFEEVGNGKLIGGEGKE